MQPSSRRSGAPIEAVICLATALVALACAGSRDDFEDFAGYNLILIGLDTVRADHLGVYGMSPSPTPEIDAFAAEAVLFRRAYSTAPWTLPSFGSLFTGLLPSEHGAVGGSFVKLAPEKLTLAELLSAHGYSTHGFVGVDWLTSEFGLEQGFDELEAHVEGAVSTRYEQYERKVHAFLDDPPREPYFLFVHIFDAHAPYTPPAPYDGMYYEGDPRAPDKDSMQVAFSDRNRAMRPPEQLYRWLKGVTDLEYPVRQYKAGISYLDRKVGDLLAKLRESGELERSIVAIVADHGEHLIEHDIYFTHYLPYEETLRVPLLLRLPGATRGGTRIDEEVSGVDLLPTLADLLDVPSPANLAGTSLVSLLSDPDASLKRRWLFAEWGGPRKNVRAVWSRDVRLLRYEGFGARRFEMYDRRSDPRETVPVTEARSELVMRLDSLLERRYAPLEIPGELGQEPELDAELIERLRALGYL